MRSRASASVALVALALLASCGKHPSAPSPVAPPPPPGLVATEPGVFATGVPEDTPVWGQFSRPLDPTSVDTTTVFLKIDTRRQGALVSYDPFSRRVIVQPRQTLQPLQTYTVEFSAEVRDTGGVTLGRSVYFQFTTSRMSRPRSDYPAIDELESPYAQLGWTPLATVGTSMISEVYAGTDSLAVLGRTVAPLQVSALTTFLPTRAWPRGARVYWSITTVDVLRGERRDGLVRSFRVYPADWPVDSLVLRPVDWTGTDLTRAQYCNSDQLWSGPDGSYVSGMRFPLGGTYPGLRLASARFELYTTAAYVDSVSALSSEPALWAAVQGSWTVCAARLAGPPNVDAARPLACARTGSSPRMVSFSGDTATSFFEAQARRGSQFGPMFRTSRPLPYYTSAATDPADRPRLVLVYYVPPSLALARRANSAK